MVGNTTPVMESRMAMKFKLSVNREPFGVGTVVIEPKFQSSLPDDSTENKHLKRDVLFLMLKQLKSILIMFVVKYYKYIWNVSCFFCKV